MENKPEGQTAVLRWENSLITAVTRCPQVLSVLIDVRGQNESVLGMRSGVQKNASVLRKKTTDSAGL